MALSDDFLQELHDRVDIESVISPYVTLKRKGKLLGGLCPFHNEKTPSFYVYPETQSYYCFGCGSGGDAITFIKNIENLDYIESVRFLCEKYGLSMPEDNYDNGLSKKRTRLFEANREAARYYYKQLFEPNGKIARDYCKKRQLTKDTVTLFGIGYASDSWDSLTNYLKSKGFTTEELIEADLAKKGRNGGCFDTFRNRLVFPIVDLRGNVLGFSGRRLNEEDRAKYVNSSDTLIYKKGREIFGLNLAKKTKADNLILCEGNIDVVMLHQAGFDNAVAALGTALTEDQAQLLSRYTGEILLCYDNDEAGAKAVEKALGIFARTTVHTKVIKMTGGKDPDEIIKNFGVARFKALIDGASNDIEYRLSEEMQKHDMLTSDGKVSFMRAAAKVLAALDSPIEVDVYASKLANELSVNKEAITSEIAKNRRKKKQSDRKEQFKEIQRSFNNPNDLVNKVNSERRNNLHAAKAEETVLATLMSNPSLYRKLSALISADDFVTPFNAKVYKTLCERLGEGKAVDITSLSSSFTSDELSVISSIIANKAQFITNSVDECEDCIAIIREDKKKAARKQPAEMTEEDFLNIFKNNN